MGNECTRVIKEVATSAHEQEKIMERGKVRNGLCNIKLHVLFLEK
jgi:hypothetical protein